MDYKYVRNSVKCFPPNTSKSFKLKRSFFFNNFMNCNLNKVFTGIP